MWYDKVFEIIEVTFLQFIGKKEQKMKKSSFVKEKIFDNQWSNHPICG